MAERFQVGDIVECVDARPFDFSKLRPLAILTLGALYTVRDFLPGKPPRYPSDGVRLANITLPLCPTRHKECAWYAGRFRLLRRPTADFLTELLTAPLNIEPELEPVSVSPRNAPPRGGADAGPNASARRHSIADRLQSIGQFRTAHEPASSGRSHPLHRTLHLPFVRQRDESIGRPSPFNSVLHGNSPLSPRSTK